MVPKIIAKGKSFKGAALYLLHDKNRALSSERVAWTETRNLACNDPNLGWKIMAATAMDQDRLKAAAGVKSTGRKSDKTVLHLSLSWHPDEKEALTRGDMRCAALGALKAIGADDRQAILIAHNDEAHPHLHILCNRVSPEDGRLLQSSNDRLNLSKWAEAYEKERGKILCEERVVNNERRRDGEYVKGRRDQAKHLLGAVNDNSRASALVQDAQRAADHVLSEKGRAFARQQRTDWRRINGDYQERRQALAQETKMAMKAACQQMGEAYHPRRRSLVQKHRLQLDAFEVQENRLLGRLKNAFDLLNLRDCVRGDEGGRAIADTFKLITSKGARRGVLIRQQEKEKSALRREQRKAVLAAKRTIRDQTNALRSKLRRDYLDLRAALIGKHAAARDALEGEWRQRGSDRKRAFQLARASRHRAGDAAVQFARAAQPPDKSLQDSRSGEAPRRLTRAERNAKKLEEIKAKLQGEKSRER